MASASSSSRPDLLLPSFLRIDGRRPYEFRSIQVDFQPCASTSASIVRGSGNGGKEGTPEAHVRYSQGLNDVSVMVFGPRESTAGGSSAGNEYKTNEKGQLGISDDGAALEVRVSFQEGAGAGGGGGGGGGGSGGRDRRSQELNTILHSILRPLLLLTSYPRSSTLTLSLHVHSLDGSLLPTLINASSIALACSGVGLRDYAVSTSVAIHPRGMPKSIGHRTQVTDATFLLDPTNAESLDLPVLTVAISPRSTTTTGNNSILLSHLDPNRGKITSDQLAEAIRVAEQVLKTPFWAEIEAAVRGWGKGLV